MTIMGKLQNFFKKKHKAETQVIYKNSTSKYSLTAECSMELSNRTNSIKQKIDTQLKKLAKKYINSPEKLIRYIKFNGIKVYRWNGASKFLSLLDLELGYITPLTGIKAVILSTIISLQTEHKLKISTDTPAMLIFDKKHTEIYTVIRALYKYYGYKYNLPGFDSKSQALYKKINKSENIVATLKLADILACKEALARDLESIDFALQLSLEYECSKKVLNKIIKEKTSTI